MNPLLFASKLYNKITKKNLKLSFSQCGEDIILLFLIRSLKLNRVQFFDIGTNDPRDMNNTYLLYMNNYRGVCVEPDPFFHKLIKKHRAGDILIPAGVSTENKGNADFYLMDDSVLNTFSLEEAEKLVKGHQRKIKKKIQVPLMSVNEIFENHYDKERHVILSLDVEGYDFPILKSINFSQYRPCIICVETIEFSKNLTGKKEQNIVELLTRNDYFLYADTYINSIFVDRNLISRQ